MFQAADDGWGDPADALAARRDDGRRSPREAEPTLSKQEISHLKTKCDAESFDAWYMVFETTMTSKYPKLQRLLTTSREQWATIHADPSKYALWRELDERLSRLIVPLIDHQSETGQAFLRGVRHEKIDMSSGRTILARLETIAHPTNPLQQEKAREAMRKKTYFTACMEHDEVRNAGTQLLDDVSKLAPYDRAAPNFEHYTLLNKFPPQLAEKQVKWKAKLLACERAGRGPPWTYTELVERLADLLATTRQTAEANEVALREADKAEAKAAGADPACYVCGRPASECGGGRNCTSRCGKCGNSWCPGSWVANAPGGRPRCAVKRGLPPQPLNAIGEPMRGWNIKRINDAHEIYKRKRESRKAEAETAKSTPKPRADSQSDSDSSAPSAHEVGSVEGVFEAVCMTAEAICSCCDEASGDEGPAAVHAANIATLDDAEDKTISLGHTAQEDKGADGEAAEPSDGEGVPPRVEGADDEWPAPEDAAERAIQHAPAPLSAAAKATTEERCSCAEDGADSTPSGSSDVEKPRLASGISSDTDDDAESSANAPWREPEPTMPTESATSTELATPTEPEPVAAHDAGLDGSAQATAEATTTAFPATFLVDARRGPDAEQGGQASSGNGDATPPADERPTAEQGGDAGRGGEGAAVARWSGGSCEAVARRLHGGCTAAAQRLRGGCTAVARRLHEPGGIPQNVTRPQRRSGFPSSAPPANIAERDLRTPRAARAPDSPHAHVRGGCLQWQGSRAPTPNWDAHPGVELARRAECAGRVLGRRFGSAWGERAVE